MTGIVIWGLVALVSCALAGLIAGWKNRDYSFWMAWGFLVPPAVILLAILPKLSGPRPRRPTLDETDRHEDRMM